MKNVGEPCAGEPHARIDGGREETKPVGLTQPRGPGASRLPDQPPREQHLGVMGSMASERIAQFFMRSPGVAVRSMGPRRASSVGDEPAAGDESADAPPADESERALRSAHTTRP